MDHKIGEIITLPDGRKVEVVKGNLSCRGCIFRGDDECAKMPCCDENGYGIIYKEIKEEEL